MSFLTSLLGLGDKKTSSSNQTSQNDNRQVNDASGGGVVGSTITYNIMGADMAQYVAGFMSGNQQASPFKNSAEANGIRSDGIGGQVAGALGGVGVLPIMLAGLVAVLALKR